jgi:hypothetical protein
VGVGLSGGVKVCRSPMLGLVDNNDRLCGDEWSDNDGNVTADVVLPLASDKFGESLGEAWGDAAGG